MTDSSFVAAAARRAREQQLNRNTIVRHAKPAFGSALSTGRSSSAADGRKHRRSVWNGERRGTRNPEPNPVPAHARLRGGGGKRGGGGGGGGGGPDGNADRGGSNPNVSAARSQLWAIVEEISGQLDTAADADGGDPTVPTGAAPRSPLPPVLHAPAQKLRRLLHLHRRMQQQERTLQQTHVAVLRERNEYLRRLGDVEAYVATALAARAAAGLEHTPGGGLLERLRAFLELDGAATSGEEGDAAFPNPYR